MSNLKRILDYVSIWSETRHFIIFGIIFQVLQCLWQINPWNKLAPIHSAYEEEKALFSTHSITNSCWDVWWGFYMVKQIQEKHESRLELQRTFRTEYSSSRTENWNWSWPFLWPQPFRSSRKSIENSSYADPDHLLNSMKNRKNERRLLK